jgi:glycosyltransferase involved in cell wall biosynthesis
MSDAFFNRPRIVWATQSATPHDRRFIETLVDSGWSVVFLSAGGNLQDLLLATHIQPFVVADSETIPDMPERGIAPRLIEAIAIYQPQLVWAGPLTTVAHEVAKVTSVPLVAMSWGYDLLRDATIDPSIAASISSTIVRASRIHVDCDAGRKAAVQLGAPQENIIQFPWGIDLTAFPLRASRNQDHQFTVVSARSMEPVYDVATTIVAFAQLTHQRPDLNAQLVLVGSGSLVHELRSTAASLDVDSKIRWMGQVTEADLQRVIADAALYVSSSSVDGSSITLLQAMAAGVTPIVSDVGGNGQWIRHGETGLLFPAGDAPALAACLEETLSNAELRNALGSAAHEEVAKHGDWAEHRTTFVDECNALSGLT